jgi:alpha-ribazole phosphatase
MNTINTELKTTFYFLRHGETDENIQKKYCGRTQTSLNATGRAQIEKVKPIVQSKGSLIPFCSPLQRCRDTYDIVKNPLHQATYANELMEFDFGIFEGKTYKELMQDCPEAMQEWLDNWKTYTIPQGEGVPDIYNRVKTYLQSLIDTYPGCNILIVSHFGVIQSALAWLLFDSIEGFWKFELKNGGLTCVSKQGKQGILHSLNEGV